VLSLRFPRVEGRQGLGAGVFNPDPTPAQRRRLIVNQVTAEEQEEHEAHAQGLAQQGVWLQWRDSTVPFDLSWKNLIYGPSPYLLKFVLNATINSVRTPDMLHRFGYVGSAECKLCRVKQCTLHHILSNCRPALKRYKWRHDSVLLRLVKSLSDFVAKWNAKVHPAKVSVPPLSSSFVSSGTESKQNTGLSRRVLNPRKLLDGAQDWQLLADFDHDPMLFPPQIVATQLRPDVVVWSTSSRAVVLFELTCPAEEGIENASIHKNAKYVELCDAIRDAGWTVVLRPIEVGARGFVARSVSRLLRELGLSSREVTTLCRSLATVVARCSFTIYLASSSAEWHMRDLLQ
jgi:hypothetical protein